MAQIEIVKLVALSALILVSACNRHSPVANNKELTVAAAADLAPAFEELGREFHATHQIKVIFSFGSTGLLAEQKEKGPQMVLFASSYPDYIDQLDKQGLI